MEESEPETTCTSIIPAFHRQGSPIGASATNAPMIQGFSIVQLKVNAAGSAPASTVTGPGHGEAAAKTIGRTSSSSPGIGGASMIAMTGGALELDCDGSEGAAIERVDCRTPLYFQRFHVSADSIGQSEHLIGVVVERHDIARFNVQPGWRQCEASCVAQVPVLWRRGRRPDTVLGRGQAKAAAPRHVRVRQLLLATARHPAVHLLLNR